MAKQKHRVFGPVSGKLAPLSAGVWKGIPYYKLLPDQGGEKKPTKASAEAKEELNRQAEASKLAVKTGQKETNVYTYWPDGSLCQWENQTEQLDEMGIYVDGLCCPVHIGVIGKAPKLRH